MLYVSSATAAGARSADRTASTTSASAHIWVRARPPPSSGKPWPSSAHSKSIANSPSRPGPRNVFGRRIGTQVPAVRRPAQIASASTFAAP
jgi:hypothetical protein